jgi:hypothetical protein
VSADGSHKPRKKILSRDRKSSRGVGTWLVLYDFKGIKPSSKYWTNLNRLIKVTGGGSLIQYSAFTTKEKRAAIAANKLAKHYGAETIVYKVEKQEDI